MVEIILPLGSLLVALGLAALQFWNWWRDKNSDRLNALLTQAHVDETRDGLIVSSAERAVTVLERTLTNVMNDNEALRNRVRTLEPLQDRVRELENEVAALRGEVAGLKRNFQ